MSLVRKVKTITGNSDYRVKDVIDKIGLRWEHSADQVRLNSKYEGTILQTYLRLFRKYEKLSRSGNPTKNSRSLLLRLIKERISGAGLCCPSTNELVVHLRMGDTVAKGNGRVRPDSNNDVFESITRYIRKRPEISIITIATCFAYQDWSESSKREYKANNPRGTIPDWGWTQEKHDLNVVRFKQLEASIRKRFPKLHLDVVSSTDIDDDMCYAAMANHFIPSRGGFTELLQELSNMNKTKSFSNLDFLPQGRLMAPIPKRHFGKTAQPSRYSSRQGGRSKAKETVERPIKTKKTHYGRLLNVTGDGSLGPCRIK